MRKLRERVFNILNEENDFDMDTELEVFMKFFTTLFYQIVFFIEYQHG